MALSFDSCIALLYSEYHSLLHSQFIFFQLWFTVTEWPLHPRVIIRADPLEGINPKGSTRWLIWSGLTPRALRRFDPMTSQLARYLETGTQSIEISLGDFYMVNLLLIYNKYILEKKEGNFI